MKCKFKVHLKKYNSCKKLKKNYTYKVMIFLFRLDQRGEKRFIDKI